MLFDLVLLAVLSVLGAVVSLRRRRHWELIVGWAFCLPLILAATAPVPVISRITGLFYRNPHRIKAMTAALAVLVIVMVGERSASEQSEDPMAAMKPRTGDGPMEVTREGRGIVMRVPVDGGGRLVVELNAAEAASLLECLLRDRKSVV